MALKLDKQTPEKSISEKVRIEVEIVVATVETALHEAILSAMDNFVYPRRELATISVCISSTCNFSIRVILDPDQRDFSSDTNGLQLTALSRFYSNANLSGIDETGGNLTVEESDLPVGE